ncbi:MAG: hypothetical protein GY754_19550 [bacterium]|nr:hypothetical protein [bacterium]
MIKKIILPLIVISIFMFSFCKKGEQTTEQNVQKDFKPNISYLDELKTIKKDKGDRKKAESLHEKALKEHQLANYDISEKYWYQAAKADPAWGQPYFNLACSVASMGSKKPAIDYLQMALALDSAKLLKPTKNDKELDSIRDTKEYKDLIKKYK